MKIVSLVVLTSFLLFFATTSAADIKDVRVRYPRALGSSDSSSDSRSSDSRSSDSRSYNSESDSSSSDSSSDDNDGIGCLLDLPENLLASFAAEFFGVSWRALLSTGCDEGGIKRVLAEYFSPDILVTFQGQQLFDNLEDLSAVNVPMLAEQCRRGKIITWVATAAEALDCNTLKVYMNELQYVSRKATVEEGALPSGREYTFYVAEGGGLVLTKANTVCTFDMEVAECPAVI